MIDIELQANQCPRCKKLTIHIYRVRMKFWCKPCHLIFGSARRVYQKIVIVGPEKVVLTPEQIKYRERHRDAILKRKKNSLRQL